MDQNGVLVSDVMLELADCLQKRLALDIADGSADLNDGNTLLVYFFSAVETALDFVCPVVTLEFLSRLSSMKRS